jgi:hypothetical protein
MSDKKDTTPKAPAKKAPKEKAPKKPGVGDVAVAAIKAGKTNEEALAAVQKAFPERKTSLASINWYRNKLRSDGEKGTDGKAVPTSRELKKKASGGDAKKAPAKKAPPKDPLA